MASSAVLAVLLGAVSFLPHYAPPACGRRTRVVRTTVNVVASAVSFQSLGVREELCDGLAALGIHEANALQQRAVPAVLGRESLIVGAQTGSGKTLSYLVPVMQSIKADEEGSVARSKPRRPRAIVLVPTRELAVQVHGVAKALSHLVKLSVGLVHGGVPLGPQAKRLDRPTDLLIATPGRLVKLMGEGAVYLGDVRHVVLDEVDTMFDAGFGPELDKVLTVTTRDLAADPNADASGAAVQHLAVGATHPESTIALYDRWLRGARPLMVAGNHMLPPTLRQRFVVCNGPDAKVAALREILGTADSAGRPLGGRVVLFCNSQQSARFVDHTLEEEGYATANYHGAIPANERAANFESFVSGKTHILVTTDLAARGLDNLDVSHVVQFDMAKTATDYVHRCGRTARAGRAGDVTSLVTKADSGLVNALKAAQKKGADLVDAGATQQREARARAATELLPGQQAAAFPDCRGIEGNVDSGRNGRMRDAGGGSRPVGRSKVGGRGAGRGKARKKARRS